MATRTTLALVLVSGTCAAVRAQEVVTVSASWYEVVGSTTNPVASPNSVLEPGEGARIAIRVEALLNGTSAIGQTVNYNPPPPPGVGTIRGIGAFAFDLNGSGGDATGTWSLRVFSPVLSTNQQQGTILSGGASIHDTEGGQTAALGSTANGTNPVENAWRGTWVPSSYSARTITFTASRDTSLPAGQTTAVLVKYGTVFDPDLGELDQYIYKYGTGSFGPGTTIPIVPGPGTFFSALGFLGLLSHHRPRRTTLG